MATVRDYFDTDFAGNGNIGTTLQVNGSAVEARIYLNFDSNAKYVSYYLTGDASIAATCGALVRDTNKFLASRNNIQVNTGREGEEPMLSTNLRFAGQVYIYHERKIGAASRREVEGLAEEHSINLQFRGPKYAAGRAKWEKPLAFICHDSRDKDAMARPIAIGLSKSMCPVWYDEFSLNVGDRLREKIERGLKETQKCVLLLTPNFLGNDGWPATEFDGFFTREHIEQKDFFLPVWFGVTEQQVFEYSPSLANRFAAQWSTEEATQLKVVNELRRKIL